MGAIFGVTVNNGVHDPVEDIEGKTCAWAPPDGDSWLDKILTITPLSSSRWNEVLGSADGTYSDTTGQTLTKQTDRNVPGSDEAYLITATGVNGPGATTDAVIYITLLARKADVRLDIEAFVGPAGQQDTRAQPILEQEIAQTIFKG